MTTPDGGVVDLSVERVLRRGEGWPLLEAELIEVPDLHLVRGEVSDSEQLPLFDGGVS